jgi:hypothetical protein
MPVLEEALYDYLTNDAGVAALVGDRVYPVRAPENPTVPYIRWQRIGAQRFYTHDSFEDTDAYVRARVQFTCIAVSPLQAIEVKEAVLLALSGYEGDMSGTLIGQSAAELELDTYDDQARLFAAIVDFQIMYEDALSTS